MNGSSTTTDSIGKKDYLGPPMNALNRSRSRSPTYVKYNDPRRSASPNVNRTNYLQAPLDRSRSPTPNFTSTHVAKLTRNSQKSNENDNNKKSVVSALQIPMEKTMKSEATLVVSDSNDHSDNASEMSDEGYRSLGVMDKGKLRTSLCSQNSTEDAEETGKSFKNFDFFSEISSTL